MMNQKQLALMTLASNQALTKGSGIEIADRPLAPGELAPVASAKRSGGVIFKGAMTGELATKLGVAFLPVVDADGDEKLALCIHGKGSEYNLKVFCLIDPADAGSLINDLMASAAQYSNPDHQGDVVKAVTEGVLAADLSLKDALVRNSKEVLNKSFADLVAKRLESKQAEFDAALEQVKQLAKLEAAKDVADYVLELSEIAGIDRMSERQSRLKEIMPEIKTLLAKVVNK